MQVGTQPVSNRKLPFTPRAKRAIELANEDVQFLQQDRIGPEHLFFGLLREKEGVAGQVLTSLGLEPAMVAERVFNHRLMQMKLVERIVRPVRAGTAYKRKMREELLAHLTAIYEEELTRLRDPGAAMHAAVGRFGEPAHLTSELESALPVSARLDYYSERWFGWRAPESAAGYLRRVAARLFLLLAMVCVLLGAMMLWSIGWNSDDWIGLRQLIALVLLTPADVFLLGWLHFKLRDTLFGVFGSRKSRGIVILWAMLIAFVTMLSGVTFVALAEWDLAAAKQLAVPFCAAGLGIAIAAFFTALMTGPTQIRDTLWACMDIDAAGQQEGPAIEPA